LTVAVRVQRKALTDDERIQMLADAAGYNRFEALGRLVHLWNKCITGQSDTLTDKQIDAFLGTGCAAALISSGLAERVDDGLRVCGAREEIEARNRRTDRARSAGLASVGVRTIGQLQADSEPTPSRRQANSKSTDLSDLRSGISGSLFSEASASDSASSETSGDLKQAGRGKRQMPRDYAPPADVQAYAALHRVNLALEVERCRDWHLANGKLRSDWNATVRNWLRTAVERRQATGGGPVPDRKKLLT
jgi:hypothetical protein